jgi:hypothetical protein
MSKVRWGVLSTAKIGTDKVLPAMQQSELCEITAISSRDVDRAKAAAEQLGIPKSYGSYEEVLAFTSTGRSRRWRPANMFSAKSRLRSPPTRVSVSSRRGGSIPI